MSKRRQKLTTKKTPETAMPKRPELKTCPTCNGKGIEEMAAGMVSRKCRKCKGSGKVLIDETTKV